MSFSTAAHEPSILSLALATTFIFLVTVAIYRLTLHPLAGVPGPVLAATTGLHETYFQLWKDGGGRHWVEVDRLHRIYGPIVRISPWEVHIADPEWNDIFKLSSKANKPWWYYKSFGTVQSTATVELDSVHKIRRKAFQTWFSSENVARNIPNVQATVKKLHDRLLDFAGHAVNLNDAYRSLAIDVATNFAFDKSFNNLDDPLFSKDFNDGIRKYSNMGMMNRYMFAVPFNLLQLLPRSISRRITHPALASFMALLHDYTRYSMSRPLVAHEHAQDMVQSMLTSDLSPELKCFDVVFGDCRSVILAGTETTATVLTCITYHLLSKPDVMRNLTQELLQAQKEKKSLGYSELRALPYLTAVIQEGLRTSYSTTGRLARYSRVADLHYKQYSLPRGTYISTSPHDVHMNPAIFPEPHSFLPERWLQASDQRRLSNHLQPWGRGTRLCLGMDLAYTDLYLTVAHLFGPQCRFNMRLFETEKKDWDAYGDFFGPMPRPGARGLRVVIEPHCNPSPVEPKTMRTT